MGATVSAAKGLFGGLDDALVKKQGDAAESGVNIQKADTIDANALRNAGANVQAPTAQASTSGPTNINLSQANAARGYQDNLAQQLQAQAAGQGPSLAQGQFQQGLDQSIASQLAQAASQRGGFSAAANRTAANNIGTLGLQGANQAAQTRMQEQLGTQALLGSTANNLRAGDAGLATTQAQLTQNNQQFNAGQLQQNSQFNAQQQQAVNSLQLQYQQLGLTADQANQKALQDYQTQLLQQAGASTAVDKNNTAASNQLITSVIGGAGAAAAAFSDERLKTNIEASNGSMKAFYDSLKTHKYDYKDQAHGKGKHVSIMAQDLEKTELGKTMVVDTKAGKVVDYGKGLAAMLAGQIELNERLSKIEKSKKGKK